MKYDMHKIKEFHKKLLEENPDYNDDLVMEFAENMPDEYAKKIQYDYWDVIFIVKNVMRKK